MIGLCSVTFREKTVEEVIHLAKKAQLQVIEWGSDVHVPETNAKHAEKVAHLMAKEGLKSNSYGTYYKLGSAENFQNYIQTAKIIGATTLRVWAGEQGSAEISDQEREKIVEDAKRIGEMAAAENMVIGLEYHSNTLTDTPESARQLMEEVALPNVLLYWQPAEDLTVLERLESLPKLAPWLLNVHVFNWENYHNRFPLAEAADAWKQYIRIIDEYSPHNQDYLLEFVPEENKEKSFFESAETLRNWVQ